jgi:hypothetical protein
VWPTLIGSGHWPDWVARPREMCPLTWRKSVVGHYALRRDWPVCQSATAGKPTMELSLRGAIVSSVMQRARCTAHSSFCSRTNCADQTDGGVLIAKDADDGQNALKRCHHQASGRSIPARAGSGCACIAVTKGPSATTTLSAPIARAKATYSVSYVLWLTVSSTSSATSCRQTEFRRWRRFYLRAQ